MNGSNIVSVKSKAVLEISGDDLIEIINEAIFNGNLDLDLPEVFENNPDVKSIKSLTGKDIKGIRVVVEAIE